MNFGQYEAFVKAVEAGTMTQAGTVSPGLRGH